MNPKTLEADSLQQVSKTFSPSQEKIDAFWKYSNSLASSQEKIDAFVKYSKSLASSQNYAVLLKLLQQAPGYSITTLRMLVKQTKTHEDKIRLVNGITEVVKKNQSFGQTLAIEISYDPVCRTEYPALMEWLFAENKQGGFTKDFGDTYIPALAVGIKAGLINTATFIQTDQQYHEQMESIRFKFSQFCFKNKNHLEWAQNEGFLSKTERPRGHDGLYVLLTQFKAEQLELVSDKAKQPKRVSGNALITAIQDLDRILTEAQKTKLDDSKGFFAQEFAIQQNSSLVKSPTMKR